MCEDINAGARGHRFFNPAGKIKIGRRNTWNSGAGRGDMA
jgi:hypothetical protein